MSRRPDKPLAAQSNDRIKRAYFAYLKDAKGRDAKSISHVARSIAQFERHTDSGCFKNFHHDQASSFKDELYEAKNPRIGSPLSMSTIHGHLMHLKAFFQWLAKQPSFKSRLNYDDADYFNMNEKDRRVAKTPRLKHVPKLEQVEIVLRGMPTTTVVDKRDRAAFALLC